MLTKAVLESRGAVLLADAVEKAMGNSPVEEPHVSSQLASLNELERKHVLKAMAETNGNLSAAAKILGLSRPTLRKRLKLYGLR